MQSMGVIENTAASNLEAKQSLSESSMYYKRLIEVQKKVERSNLQQTKIPFKEMLDVKHFRPSEINVKISEGIVVVDAHHELQADEHGFTHRKFTRKFYLPVHVKWQNIVTFFSQYGILTVKENGEDETSITQSQMKLKSLRSPKRPLKKLPFEEKEKKQAFTLEGGDKVPQKRKDGNEQRKIFEELKSLKSPPRPVKKPKGKQYFKPGDEDEISQK